MKGGLPREPSEVHLHGTWPKKVGNHYVDYAVTFNCTGLYGVVYLLLTFITDRTIRPVLKTHSVVHYNATVLVLRESESNYKHQYAINLKLAF